jgi:hypothetical protein
LHRSYAFWYCRCSIILFSFPSSPKFHRVVSLLWKCFTHKFEYDHVYVYMFLFWICLPHMRENLWPLSFWTWFTSFNIFSNCIASIYCQTTWFHSSLWLNKTTLHKIYMYICLCMCIYSSVVGHLNFLGLTIVNSAAINISVQVSLLYPDLTFFQLYAKEQYYWIVWPFYF